MTAISLAVSSLTAPYLAKYPFLPVIVYLHFITIGNDSAHKIGRTAGYISNPAAQGGPPVQDSATRNG